MPCREQFSDVTKIYLCRFYEILDEMIIGMTNVRLTDSISHNFIRQMIPHHEAAIQMSQNLLQYTTLVPLQNIAQQIIAEQTRSINNMQQILSRCGIQCSSQCDLHLYQERFQPITETMFRKMRTAKTTNSMNGNFMRELIPHHRGAIQMSENALSFPICPELIPILEAIIRSQTQGVQDMERLLRCLGQ